MASKSATHKLTVYLNDDDFNLLKAKTEYFGMKNQSEFIRHMIRIGATYTVDFREIHEDNRLLSNLTNNLNQIAHQANSCGYVTKSDLAEVKKILEDVWQLQKSMLSKLLFKNP